MSLREGVMGNLKGPGAVGISIVEHLDGSIVGLNCEVMCLI